MQNYVFKKLLLVICSGINLPILNLQTYLDNGMFFDLRIIKD